MSDYTLTLQNLTKSFGRRLIFKEINYEFKSGLVYGLAGKNGSGKSTLAKILSGIISPTSGKVVHKLNDKVIEPDNLHNHLGFVSPYLVLYDEFSAEENFSHFFKIRGMEVDNERIKSLLNDFGLYDRRNDILKTYSSGMKQRIKTIFALLHSPELLILDEPTSNLDISGKEKIYETIKKQSENRLIIIASNEESDLSQCSEIIYIEKYL